MAQDLTIKQRKWMSHYIETGNATRAALIVYFPDFPLDKPIAELTEEEEKDYNSAKTMGWENLTKLDYALFLEEAGITDDLLRKTLNDGLVANKTVSARVTGKDADSKTDDFIDVPDNAVRHKYMETALRLKQRLLTRFDVTSGGEPIAILGGITKDALPTDNSNSEAAAPEKKD